LWANYDKFETLKDVAKAINTPYKTTRHWIDQSRKLTPKIKEYSASGILTNAHARELVKYPHSVQDRLADVIIRKKYCL